MQKSIVVAGSLNIDLVARVKRLPSVGETLTGVEFGSFCGGKGANQAVALARLGASVRMIGKVGKDVFAERLLESLERAGIDTMAVGAIAGPSGIALITTSADGDNTIVVVPGANHSLLPADIGQYRSLIAGAAMLLAQLEVPLETTEHLATFAKLAGVPFLLDPAPALPLSAELLKATTWLTPNETEARVLLGIDPASKTAPAPPESANKLLDLGVQNVVMKLGARGVYLAGADVEAGYVPGFSVNAIDTTAAGDAFNGAFAFALARCGLDARDAARFACAAAALSVTRQGAQDSMPEISECLTLLRSQGSAEIADRIEAKVTNTSNIS